jgi:hypothetical protein
MRLRRREQQQDFVQPEMLVRAAGEGHMGDGNGIEGAAEDPQLPRPRRPLEPCRRGPIEGKSRGWRRGGWLGLINGWSMRFHQ